jgi:hypothetical protein
MSLEKFIEFKKAIAKAMSDLKVGNGKKTVTIQNKTLIDFVTGTGYTANQLDEAVKLALQEKGFDMRKPFISDINPMTYLVTYTQESEAHDQQQVEIPLLDSVCEKYGITTEMGKLALKQALANLTLFDKKQRDYGSGNISDFGELGVLIRLNDKINRLKNLLQSKGEVNCESVADTWDDIANYGIIGKLCSQNLWK